MRRETGQLEKQQEMVKRDALGLVRFVIKFWANINTSSGSHEEECGRSIV